MNNVILSILLVLVGLFIGIILMFVINYIKGINVAKKTEALLEKARKDADKIKRDYLLDAKEEAHRLKIETDKEIKEKKQEIKESEDRLLVRENNKWLIKYIKNNGIIVRNYISNEEQVSECLGWLKWITIMK